MDREDNTTRILRELRESADRQRFWSDFRRRTVRLLVPFYGTRCPWAIHQDGRWHTVRMSFILMALFVCLALSVICMLLVLLLSY